MAACVAADIYAQEVGCGSIDPTDPANYSAVEIRNDTTGTVVVDDCAGTECLADSLPTTLRPGQAHEDHAACGTSTDDMTSWEVKTTDGKVLGYIAVDTPRKHDGLVFPISGASANRTTPTAPNERSHK